jgi:hypothetical protein
MTVTHPAVAWCKVCHVGRPVADVTTDGQLIVFAHCEHEAVNPDHPRICSCRGRNGWSSDCPVHRLPPKQVIR